MIVKSGFLRKLGWAGFMSMTLAVFAAGQTQTPAQKYEALLGSWDVQAEGVSYTFVFEFFIENGVLMGKYTGSSGTTKMDNLTFEDNNLRFSVTVSTMTLSFEAIVDGEKLNGQVTLQYGQADITGQKRKK